MSKNNNNIYKEAKERFLIPFKESNYAFFGYFVGILIGFGGLGIWVSIYQEITGNPSALNAVPINISTYFMALLASSFIDLNVLPNVTNRVSLLIYSVIFLGLGFFLFFLTNNSSTSFAYFPAIIGFLFALFSWHIANADSDKFNDESFNKQIIKEATAKHGGNW